MVSQTDDPQLQDFAAALEPRYGLGRLIGQGGMGAVYLATDRRHDRQVAIKVLESRVSSAVATGRFVREVRIAAQLSHPHILPLYDSGSAAGRLYYVMPYVDGPSLRDRLEEDGPFPADEVVRLGQDLAGALEYAHSHDVIHRDVKPANVLLASGQAVIADFGLARALNEAAQRDLTADRVVVGTPQYMSPEQMMGSRQLDGRTDVYSLACTLFEAATGEPPFAGDAPAAVLGAKISGSDSDLRRRARSLPARLRTALLQGMEPDPGKRFARAAELGEALGRAVWYRSRSVVAATLVAVLAVATAALAWTSRDPGFGPPSLVSNRIAVATIVNQTGDPELDAVADMTSEWLTEALQRSGIVDVVPTTTVRAVERRGGDGDGTADPGDPMDALARATGAGLVVSGSLYRQSDSVRLHVQVTNTRSRRVAGTLDPITAPVDDPHGALAEAGSRLPGALAAITDQRLATAPGALASPPTLEAYRHFTEGMEAYSRHRPKEALPWFAAASRSDPGFLQALLFEGLMLSNDRRYAEADSVLALVEHRRDRLSLHDQHWLDYRRALHRGDRPASLRAIRRASELAPVSRASYNLAVEAMENGELLEAREALARLGGLTGPMQDFSPYLGLTAMVDHLLGRHGPESDMLDSLVARFPREPWGKLLRVGGLAALGRDAQVLAAIHDIASDDPGDPAYNRLAVARRAADELRAHDRVAASRRVLEDALAWLDRQPDDIAALPHLRMEHVAILRRLDRWADARAVLDPLLAERPDDMELRILDGVIAARLGDTERRQAAEEWLTGRSGEYLMGAPQLGLARIAAVDDRPRAAADLLRQARRNGLALGQRLHLEPDLDALGRDPSYAAVVRPWTVQ